MQGEHLIIVVLIIALLYVIFAVYPRTAAPIATPIATQIATSGNVSAAAVPSISAPIGPTMAPAAPIIIAGPPAGYYAPPYMWHGGWRRFGWGDGPRPRRWWRR